MNNIYVLAFNLLLGIWLLLSPYILDFTGNLSAYWNALIAGALLVVSSLIEYYFRSAAGSGERLKPKTA